MNLTFETARAQSELFTFQCSQWELIWNSQLIGRYKEMSPGESYSQWELIWNSQLIRRYKEMSPGESYNIPPRCTLKLPEHRVNSLLFNAVNEHPLETVKLIRRYKEMSPGESYSQWELIWNSQLIGRYKEMSPGESYIWNCQSSEWTLHFSMQSMSIH